MKDPYAILGMSRDSSVQDLRSQYDTLKRQYSEQRFESGERGNEGARLLSELETAWKIVEQDIGNRERQQFGGGGYVEIDNCLKVGEDDRAQDVLDSMSDRDGKWHYYQSIIFYKKEWLSESRAQLVIAMQMEPNNTKYSDSLRKIDIVMGKAGIDPSDIGSNAQGPYANHQQQYNQQQYQNQNHSSGNSTANTCSNCLCAYCITEMCCTMSRMCH